MRPSDGVREGYLIIADISGYTRFLTGVELDHGAAILRELTERILRFVRPPFKLAKLEGDAVFYFAYSSEVGEGDRILDNIEACYCDFASHLVDMKHATTCTCAACREIDKLGLKFVAHYGTFLVQRIGANEELSGADVILAHRLLKNSLPPATNSYALLTQACLERTGKPSHFEDHCEEVEHLGQVSGAYGCLHAVYEETRSRQTVFIAREDADLIHEAVFEASPEELWIYVLDPVHRLKWQGRTTHVKNLRNEDGRFSVGAENHCAHGRLSRINRILDMRPFRYVTLRSEYRPSWLTPTVNVVYEMAPREDGRTLLSFRLRAIRRDPITVFLTRRFSPLLVKGELRFDRLREALGAKATAGDSGRQSILQ